MLELWQAATTTINLPFTLFLGLVMVYWLGVIIGALDLDFLDFHLDGHQGPDLDVDLHADMDLHSDLDADADLHADPGHLADVLTFFNIGAIPFMVVISIFSLSLWTLAMVIRIAWPAPLDWVAFLTYIPILLGGVLLTKLVTTPLAKLFAGVGGKALSSVQGQVCTLLSDADESRLAQGRVITDGSPFVVNVRTRPGEKLPKGSRALIIEKDAAANFYYVEHFDAWED